MRVLSKVCEARLHKSACFTIHIKFFFAYKLMYSRLALGTSHPTIKSVEQGLYVLSRFAADFEEPIPQEGYDRIISLKPADHLSPVYSRSEVAAILQRLYDSSPLVSAVKYNPSRTTQPFQGSRSVRGYPYRGYSTRGHFGASNQSMPRGRGFSPDESLNIHPTSRNAPYRARGGAGSLGMGYGPSHQSTNFTRTVPVSSCKRKQPINGSATK